MENGSPAARKTHQSGLANGGVNGIGAAGRDLRDLIEANAVLVAKRQVKQQIVHRMNAARSKGGRALRTDAFEILHFRGGGYIHPGYIYHRICMGRACIHGGLLHRLAAGPTV